MFDEPIPDEFGSWARLLPTPEEKQPAAEKAADEKAFAPKAAEEQPVIPSEIGSAADETATLAFASDETAAGESSLEPGPIEYAEAKAASEEPILHADVIKPVAAENSTEHKTADGVIRSPKAIDEIAAGEPRPVEALANKPEPKAADEPVTVKPAEHKAVDEKRANDKQTSQPAIDEKVKRPFRVKLRGSLLVLVRLPNKRTIQGSFHQLSISGGVIHFEKPLDEKLEVELIFHLKETTIRSKAQMLFPMWATQGWMQPFRFVGLADDNRRVLDQGLKLFVGDLANGASAGA